MQSLTMQKPGLLKNPLMGNTLSTRVAAPTPRVSTPNIPTRDVTTMAKRKGIRLIVTLECTEARQNGETPSRYVTQKNRKNTAERLELKKYNPFLRRHTIHKEIK